MGDKIVADVSVIVKWVIPEDYTEHALRLRDDFLNGRVEIHAPSIILLEAASALRKYHLKRFIDRDVAEKALELIARSEVRLHEIDPNIASKSLKISLDYNITVYDAAYIALASSLNATMYTADDRLLSHQRMPELSMVKLKHIKEYSGAARLGEYMVH
ncbi:MAG: type II toxin-antitoxin system VapC family toxin [Candidatus Bathyarchaeota archaeon]|nr:type II toxin-antitoxin system VapC family toxin [Candidatus Bathyarchaeota archaeon]